MQDASGSGAPPAGETPDLAALFAQRREEELAKRDKSLAEFLVMLDGYKPLVRFLVPGCCHKEGRIGRVEADGVDTGGGYRVLPSASRIRVLRSKIVRIYGLLPPSGHACSVIQTYCYSSETRAS